MPAVLITSANRGLGLEFAAQFGVQLRDRRGLVAVHRLHHKSGATEGVDLVGP